MVLREIHAAEIEKEKIKFTPFNIEERSKPFEGVKKPQKKYVERIKSGRFMEVNGDVDLGRGVMSDVAALTTNRYQLEYEVIENMGVWTSRIMTMFQLILGFLGGMSVIHIILISITVTDFLAFYASFAMIFNLILLILANLCLIFGLAVTFILYSKSKR